MEDAERESAKRMYTCITCGAQVKGLYHRYSPSVLKLLKCDVCHGVADKYIEYDPVIVLVDLVLLEKPAYRHLLYNSDFNSYWKLMIVLILGESFRIWSCLEDESRENDTKQQQQQQQQPKQPSMADPVFQLLDRSSSVKIFQGERNFYLLLAHTALSLSAFVCVVLLITELRWIIINRRPFKYKPLDLIRALIIGGCAKLLGLLGIVWQHVSPEPQQILIYGYTVLCLLTAYSVVCESGRAGSLIGLAGGLLAHNYVYNIIPGLYLSTANMTLLQTQGH